MKTEFTKLEAITYLCNNGPSFSNEWTEAGMFNMICEIVNSENEIFTKEYLDSRIKIADEF
jgi:hypothetical protein